MKSKVMELKRKTGATSIIIARVIHEENTVRFSSVKRDVEICIGSETLDEQMTLKLKDLIKGITAESIQEVKTWVHMNFQPN